MIDVLRARFFSTHCYCFECGADWEGDLESHECRVDAPESLTSPRTGRDTFPISPSESPYEYVEALRKAQGGRCTCGKCARSIQNLSLYEQFMLSRDNR